MKKELKKAFFLHIPKTAGTAFNEIFKTSVPEGRFFEHMESRRELFFNIVEDGGPFFASGHFNFQETNNIIGRSDILAITILRNPVQHLISHLKWVKAHGDINNQERHKLLPPHIADIAIRLHNTSLMDINSIDKIISTPIGLKLFDNLQTRYLSESPDGLVERCNLHKAVKNCKKFNLIFTLEDMDLAVEYLSFNYIGISKIREKNKSLIQEEVNFGSKEVLDFYRFKVAIDAGLYVKVREYSRNKYFSKF
jgi:hypothetical protein